MAEPVDPRAHPQIGDAIDKVNQQIAMAYGLPVDVLLGKSPQNADPADTAFFHAMIEREQHRVARRQGLIPNTNEWRKRMKRLRRFSGERTPLRRLGDFLHMVGPCTDPHATLSPEAQRMLGRDPPVAQFYQSMTALPGVPQDHLEEAWAHVEERMRRVRGTGSRARSTMTWLGRWARWIGGELDRRIREGPRTPLPSKDSLAYWSVGKATYRGSVVP